MTFPDSIIITGKGFIGNAMKLHVIQHSKSKVFQADRTGSARDITSIVKENSLDDFAVVLNGWSGVHNSHRDNSELQAESLKQFKLQLEEVVSVRPRVTLGLGTQAELNVETSVKSEVKMTYAQAKIEASEAFLNALDGENLMGHWLRLFSIYGTGMDQRWIIPSLIHAAKTGATMELGPCNQKWGFLNVQDLCRGIEAVILNSDALPRALDVGYPAISSLRELVCEIEDFLGVDVANFSAEKPENPDSIPNLAPLASIGWQPAITLIEGLRELSNEYS